MGGVVGRAVADGNTRGPAARLARLLRRFGVTSTTIRIGDERAKGYKRADFEDAFVRYGPFSPPESRDVVTTLDNQGPAGQNEDVTAPFVTTLKSRASPWETRLVTLSRLQTPGRGRFGLPAHGWSLVRRADDRVR